MTTTPPDYDPSAVGPEPDPTAGFTAPDPDASRDDFAGKIKRAFSPKEKPPPKRKTTPPMPRGAGFTPQLEGLYAGIGAMIYPFDNTCGNAVMQAAPKCAETLNDLAKQNEAVRRFLFAMLETSAIGAVIFAHAPIIMTVAMHHSPGAQKAAGQAFANMAEQMANQNGRVEPDND